jgi:hypothetical protein
MEKRPAESSAHTINLPWPKYFSRRSLRYSLRSRKTTRSIGKRDLSLQQLSNLLWAADGINRKNGPFDGIGRTAASASNSQEIAIYAARKEGTYTYDPMAHQLILIAEGDSRGMAIGRGQGEAGSDAPVRLIFVADIDAYTGAGFQEPGLYDPEIQKSYFYVAAGIIAENVYLFAASEGLAAWFHNCRRLELRKKIDFLAKSIVWTNHRISSPGMNSARQTLSASGRKTWIKKQ